MRRILRKVAEGDVSNLGDTTSTGRSPPLWMTWLEEPGRDSGWTGSPIGRNFHCGTSLGG